MYGLPWEVSGAVWRSPTTAPATVGEGPEKSAEAIVVPTSRDEGPNPLLQGASREDSMAILGVQLVRTAILTNFSEPRAGL